MKQKPFFIFCVALVVLAISACCTKKDCRTIDDITEIQLVNFAEHEVDSMVIETLDGVTGSRLDSTFTSAQVSGSYMAVQLPGGLDLLGNYRLINLSTGQVDTVNHFITERKKCNTCFPSKNKGNVTVLESFDVNGETFAGETVSVAKQ